jgi:hypothetical protein
LRLPIGRPAELPLAPGLHWPVVVRLEDDSEEFGDNIYLSFLLSRGDPGVTCMFFRLLI